MDETNKSVEINVSLALNADSSIATIVFTSAQPMTNDSFLGAAEQFIAQMRSKNEAEKVEAPNNECGAV